MEAVARPAAGFDVIVVGGGIAGLAAGALLAHGGARVLVLERRPVLGGRALVVQQQGFTLNYGVHYIALGPASAHYRILKTIGKLEDVPLAPVDASKLFRWRYGRLHPLPTTPTALLRTSLLSARGKVALVKALAAILTAKVDSLWDVPVKAWVRGVTIEPTLRDFLYDMVGPLTFEPDPERLSAAHFVLAARPLLFPKGPIAYYPGRGWASLFDALKARIEETGGEVRLKAKADRLDIDTGQVSGVWSQGERVPCRAVVLALPPDELGDLLAETPIASLSPERLKRIRPTMGVAVDLGVTGLANDRIGTIELPELPGTIGIHNLFEPSLAPPGGHLIQYLRLMTPEQMDDKAEVERTEDMALDFLSGIWPDIREKVVVRRTLVRRMLTAASHAVDQARPTLLPIDVGEVVGLYLAGDATNTPGELSGASCESALLCAEQVATWLRQRVPA